MNYKGQPSNRIISRKFVETTVIILFVLNLIATIALLITGIVYNTQDNNAAMYYYISAICVFLGCCIFLSFLIVHILKVCELEKINYFFQNSDTAFFCLSSNQPFIPNTRRNVKRRNHLKNCRRFVKLMSK